MKKVLLVAMMFCFAKLSIASEEICINGSCLLRVDGINYTTPLSKNQLDASLKKLGTDWELETISIEEYQNFNYVETRNYTLKKRLKKDRVASCIFSITQKFLEGGIPTATVAGTSGASVGGTLGGVAGFGLSSAGVVTIATAPVAVSIGSSLGAVTLGGLAGLGGLVGGGTANASRFLASDRKNACGNFYSYELLEN